MIQAGRSQRELAVWLGESPKRINHYLTGVSNPAIDFLVKLAENGINMNWFLTGEGPVYIESGPGGDLPANVQVLLKEIELIPGIVEDLTEVVRSKRKMEESLKVLQNALKGGKKRS